MDKYGLCGRNRHVEAEEKIPPSNVAAKHQNCKDLPKGPTENIQHWFKYRLGVEQVTIHWMKFRLRQLPAVWCYCLQIVNLQIQILENKNKSLPLSAKCWLWRYSCTDIRLVNGSDATQGRLEVYYDGEWGTVCDDWYVLAWTSLTFCMVGCFEKKNKIVIVLVGLRFSGYEKCLCNIPIWVKHRCIVHCLSWVYIAATPIHQSG